MSEPAISASGEYLYNRVLPLFSEDERFGFFGRLLVDAVMSMMQGVDQIILDQPPVVPIGVGVANLVINPSFRYDASGAEPESWIFKHSGSTIIKYGKEASLTHGRQSALRMTARIPGGKFITIVNGNKARVEEGTLTPASPGEQFSASATFNVLSCPQPGAEIFFEIRFYNSKDEIIIPAATSTFIKSTGEVQATIAGAFAPANTASVAVGIVAQNTGGTATIDFQVERLSLTRSAGVQPYYDGDSPLCEWAGEPGPSLTLFMEASPEHPGWCTILDPHACPAKWLPWCAQLYGVELLHNATSHEQRQAIIEVAPQKRGTTASILKVVQRVQVPGSQAAILERQNSSGEVKPYWFTLVAKAMTFKAAISSEAKTESGKTKIKLTSEVGLLIEPGALISSGSFAAGTTVSEVVSTTEVIASASASATSTETITFLNPSAVSQLETEIAREKPAGIRYNFVFGKRYLELESGSAKYSTLEAGYATYGALESAT